MKKIYQEHLKTVRKINNNFEKITYLTSILRSLLQLAVVSSFEIASHQTPSDEIDLPELTDKFSKRFRKPTDSLPLYFLNTLTPIIRDYTNKQFLYGWFENTKNIDESISKQLTKWVEFRNERQAHGVIDPHVADEWSRKTEKIIRDCLTTFSNIIPKIEDNDKLILSKDFDNLNITTPLFVNNHAIVISNVIARKGLWKLNGQLLSLENAKDFTVVLPENNIFTTKGLKPTNKYYLTNFVSNNNDYCVFHNIPVRQTDTFEGRKNELSQLVEWIDNEDSRKCLVFGDGGYGKTTLVLEMLNQLLESQYDFNKPLPELISYYTAKMTRWNETGLVHSTAINPIMDECIKELMRFFYPILPHDWYNVSGRQLIDKSVSVLKKNKYTRNDVLMIIDNTETFATSPQEVKELATFFNTVGKLIGRIIITSRRREFVEATPIQIEGLSEVESVNLIQSLAKDYNARSILQAGESRLRKVSKQLMYKPLLLESLVKYISHSDSGIDVAINNLFKKSNEDLLEFLYEDAWLRMNQLQQEVFLVLIHISSPLDQTTISKACQEVGIQLTEFQEGLGETHFSIMTDYGRTYTIEFVDLARRFFLQQFGKLNQTEKGKLKSLASSVDTYTSERDKIEKEYKTDRIAEAFRNEYAKAAKIYTDNGDIKNAIEMYELAISYDPLNSALYDRFSWVLLNKANKFNYAKIISKRAIELDENNYDAIVGLALVHYRLGEIEEGDNFIEQVENKGRTLSFCLLKKATARFFKAKKEDNLNTKSELLEQALELLEQAKKRNTINNGYDNKNADDIQSYQDRTRRELTNLRAKITRLKKLNIDIA